MKSRTVVLTVITDASLKDLKKIKKINWTKEHPWIALDCVMQIKGAENLVKRKKKTRKRKLNRKPNLTTLNIQAGLDSIPISAGER